MKKGKRIVSLALALTMAFSATAAAFAVSAAEEKEPVYTPTYNDRVTEEKTQELVTFLDTTIEGLIAPEAGKLLTTIYQALPGLTSMITMDVEDTLNVSKVDFYKDLDPAFTDLTDADGTVTAEELIAYLADHPVTVKDMADLSAKLDKLVEKVVNSVMWGVGFALFGAPKALITQWGLVGTMIPDLLNGLDGLAAALEIDCGDYTLFEIRTELTNNQKYQEGVDVFVDYIQGILHALIPNTVDKVLGLVKTYADNQAEVLSAASLLVKGLGKAGDLLSRVGVDLGTIDLAAIGNWCTAAINAYTVETDVQAVDAEGNPIVDDTTGEPVYEKVLDLDGVINTILDGATGAFGGLVDIPDVSETAYIMTEGVEGVAPKIALTSVNDLVASIADEGVESTADVLMVALNYVYANIFANQDNMNGLLELLGTIPALSDYLPMIEGMLPTLAGTSTLDLLDTVMVLVGILPEKPSEVPPTDPTQPSGTTDTGDNTNPGTGDAMFVVVAGAGVLAAGAVIVLAKKREH
ncbi:MAG TPA: hypothetical protein IAB39_02220 [Candidatus Onthovicinus excrementipullorum]|nr:hypothetical protein [Candidatus Onthovicinus excrementipullorum]